jgi:hypothetical protein
MAFPKDEKINFIKEKMAPLIGLDTTGISTYFQALALKAELSNVRTEIGRRLIEGNMTDSAAVRWTMEYNLANEKDAIRSISFAKKYQSYVINYTYGMALVKDFMERNAENRDPEKKWAQFEWLLSNQVTPGDLKK